MAPLNILIAGCSVAGPSLASFLLLAQVPHSEKPHITLLERSSSLRKQGQNVDIRGVGVTMLRKLGIEAAVRAATTGEEGVQWVNKNNVTWASFGAGSDEKMHNPTSDIEIMRGQLAHVCWKRSQEISDYVQSQGGPAIEYIFGDYIESLDQEDGQKVHVRFAKSGTKRTFDLVVGADGLHSSTRKMVWGVESEEQRIKSLDMYGAYFSIPRGETDTMWRRCFHTMGRRVMMVRPDKQNGRTTVLLTVVNDKDRRLLDAAKSSGPDKLTSQKALIKEYFQNAGWESDRLVDEMMKTDDFYYDMAGQVKLEKWRKGRVVLLGDAAYCASHMSGMGTTLAMFGGYNLAGALMEHPTDLGAALEEYESRVRPAVDRAQNLTPGIQRIMSPETAWGVWLIDSIITFLIWSRLVNLLFMLKGPDSDETFVHDYPLIDLQEVKE